MAASETLMVFLRANTAQFQTKMREAEAQIDGFAANGEGKLASFMGSQAGGLAAVAAAGVVAAGVSISLANGFAKSTSEVRTFQRVTGTSAETASKFTYALDALGVGADKGGNALFMLSRKIGTGKDNLDQFGVSVVRAKDGSVNLEATLYNIADAYNSTGDPATKAALLMSAFGRQGKDLIPVLQRGRDGIKELFDEAGRTNHIFSQEDLDRGREYSLAMHELTQTFEGFKLKAGGSVAPVLTDLAEMGSSLLQLADGAHVFEAWGVAIQTTLAPLTELIRDVKELSDLIGLTSKTEMSQYSLAQKVITQNQAKYNDLVVEGKGKTKEAKDALDQIHQATVLVAPAQEALGEAMQTTGDKAAEEAKQIQAAQKAIDDEAKKIQSYTDATWSAVDAGFGLADAQARLAEDAGKTGVPLEQLLRDTEAVTKAAGENAEQQLGPGASAYEKTNASIDAQLFTLAALKQQYPQLGPTIDQWTSRLLANRQAAEDSNTADSNALGVLDSLKGKYKDLAPQIDALETAIRKKGEAQAGANASDSAAETVLLSLADKYPELRTQIDQLLTSIHNIEGTHNAVINIDTYRRDHYVTDSRGQVVSGGGGPGHYSGGMIPGSPGVPYPATLHGGEYVLSADVVQRIKQGQPSIGAAAATAGGVTIVNYQINATAMTSREVGRAVVDALQDEARKDNGARLRAIARVPAGRS